MAMTMRDLVRTSSLAQQFGVKAIVYSGPGYGKTPLLTTAPSPVICFSEPGFKSVSTWDGPAYPAFTYGRIKDFLMWAIGSQEARQFGTFCFDSVSQMAEIILSEEMPKHKDPRKAYGELSLKMMELMNWIYFAPGFNCLMIAKEDIKTDDNKYRPYFPGKDLNIKIPHLFDSVWRIEEQKNLANNTTQRVMRTRESFEAFARDRSGKLAEIEPADINYLFAKSIQ